MPKRITAPTDAELRTRYASRFLKQRSSKGLEPATRYAIVLLTLADAVTDEDYPTLATGIKGVAGVVDIDLLIDHITPAEPPENETTTARIEAAIIKRTIEPVPEA